MCVIICCDKESGFPSKDVIKNAELMNGHGGGIAWLSSTGMVVYKKGIDSLEINNIIENEAQLPAIIHFRIASVGNVVEQLCHPFPVTDSVSLDLSGVADKVLFHNGTWGEWQEVLLQAVISGQVVMPDDNTWSDSRCMALLVNRYGNSILNLIDDGGKIAILSKDGIKKYGSGWINVNNNSCSNSYFMPSVLNNKIKKSKHKKHNMFDSIDDDYLLSEDEWYNKHYKVSYAKQKKKEGSTLDEYTDEGELISDHDYEDGMYGYNTAYYKQFDGGFT